MFRVKVRVRDKIRVRLGVRNRVRVKVRLGVRASLSTRVIKKLVISPSLGCMQNRLYILCRTVNKNVHRTAD